MHANTIESKRHEFILRSHKCSSENYEGEVLNNDDYEDAYIDISGTTGARLTNVSRTEYQEMYENMNEELKWRLKSGRYVEDVIYEFGCLHQFEDLSHSFIIDLEDCQIMGLFTDEEREEIKSKNIKYDPELDKDVTNVRDIREMMAQFSVRQGAGYTVQKDFSTDIIIYAIHSLGNPAILQVVTEKNRKRKRKDKKALERHSDAIIRKNTNGQTLKFGGSEVGRFYNRRVMMLMTLDNLAGYVMRLTKSDIFKIPKDVESFSLTLELIGAVWMFK
ncbi:7560_t:CDS:2, partial [Funneliformis caledonium]